MRTFVSGGSGFIGSHLIDALLENGWDVRALAHHGVILREGEVEVLRGDICDRAVLKQGLKGTEILFHLASALGSSLISRDEFFRVNARGTEAVLETAREEGVRKVIHMSSAGVLGAVAQGDIAAEDYPPRPRQVYDLTKLEGERTALRFARMGLDIVVIRPGWAYGPRDGRTLKLIRAICGKKILAMPRGKARQTPVYVTDLVRGILLAAEKGLAGTIYHLAGDEVLTAGKMVEVISSSCGRKNRIFRLPVLPARLAAFVLEKFFSSWQKEPPLNRPKLSFFLDSKPLSIEKARRELGFSPEVPFVQGIDLALSWYREHGWLEQKS
jgi:nucleoside-diphosphate-sugar epimerase